MNRFFLAAVAICLLTVPALADGNFVKFGNIRGNATEIQHQGWIEAGQWGTEKKEGFWLFSAPKTQFWFDKKTDAASGPLQRALQDKTYYETALFDVSIKGTIFRTTFHSVRVVAVETHGNSEKITLQFKTQKEQQISYTAASR